MRLKIGTIMYFCRSTNDNMIGIASMCKKIHTQQYYGSWIFVWEGIAQQISTTIANKVFNNF